MGMNTLSVLPGVDTQASKLAAHNKWNQSNLIRFKDGFLQKLGGCQRLSTTQVVGVCSGLHVFRDLSENTYLAVGTDQRLQIYNTGKITDITPYRTSTTPSGPFGTTINLATVLVTNAGHGASNTDWVYITGSSAVGGLTLAGFYQVSNVTTDTYKITASSAATSTTTGGGSPTINYLIHSDITIIITPINPAPLQGVPYGYGLYGVGNYGQGGKTISSYVEERQWSLDNWGQDLVACPTDGPLYLWTPPISPGNNAALITGTSVPTAMTGMFVAMPERQIMAYGAEQGGTQDPLLIRFCDVNDYTDWAPSATNQAGSFRLSSGSKIIGGMQASQSALFWTDIELWNAQYIGFPLVWGFNKVGTGCGLIGQRAAGTMMGSVFWMGASSFFTWNGSSVTPLPCSVWDAVFDNIDRYYTDSVICAPNSWFQEIAWYFPTTGTYGTADSYVKFNVTSRAWDYGVLTRIAWIDESPLGAPIGIDNNYLIQQHETATDLDGVAMDAWAETGWFDISNGAFAVFMERFLPDFIMSSGATMLITVNVVDYDGDTPRSYGPFAITAASPYTIVRARGRFASVRVESKDLGSSWRLGEILYVTAPAGRRIG